MADQDISTVVGNASEGIKQSVLSVLNGLAHRKSGFGDVILLRMKTREVSIIPKTEEGTKIEARTVNEIVVHPDMLNGGGAIHGGCSAYLIDVCSTVALIAYSFHETGELVHSVSQSLNVVYHSPAVEGDVLKIVSTSMTVGGRAMSCRCEIWNETHRRLVASGVHIKMVPSLPKNKL